MGNQPLEKCIEFLSSPTRYIASLRLLMCPNGSLRVVFNCLPTNGFSTKPPEVKLPAEQISQPRSCPSSSRSYIFIGRALEIGPRTGFYETELHV